MKNKKTNDKKKSSRNVKEASENSSKVAGGGEEPKPTVVREIQALIGANRVLLHIPRGKKKPVRKGWQRTPLSKMSDPRYLAQLNGGGNIGVLLGDGLNTIDIDHDEDVEPFLCLNPRLRKTLRTRRSRGCNFWILINGSYPSATALKTEAGKDWGEWRADGNQTVIYGEAIDPTKGEQKPVAYKIEHRGPLVKLAFHEIVWPNELVLKWRKKKKEKQRETTTTAHVSDDRIARFKKLVDEDGRFGRTVFKMLNGKPTLSCYCPFKHEDEKQKPPRATIHLTGVINYWCHHEKCKATDRAEHNEWLQTLWQKVQGWVHIVETKSFLNIYTHLNLDKEQFNNRHAHEFRIVPTTVVLRNPKFPKYDHQIYLPAKPTTFKKNGHSYYNLWRPQTEIVPAEADVTPFLKHLEWLLPDERQRTALDEWRIWNIQHPGEKLLWVPVIYGGQEVGKSILGYIMEHELGSHNIVRPTNDMLHETYTDWAKDRCLAIIEELMTIGRQEQMNKLKAIITEPTIMIRGMYKGAYVQLNTINLIAFTNYADAVKLDPDDRRYAIFAVPAKPHPEGPAYYRRLWEWVKTPRNQSALLYRDQHYDLSNFDQYASAPMTEEKLKVIHGSEPEHQQYMRRSINDRTWPFTQDVIPFGELYEVLRRLNYNVGHWALQRSLQALGAHELKQIDFRSHGHGQQSLWIVRNHNKWIGAKRDALQAETWPYNDEPSLWAMRPM